MNIINAVTIGKLIAAHREGARKNSGLMSSSLPKPMSSREMTVPLTSSAVTIPVTMASREKSFWMKQASRLYTMKRVGTNPKS